MKRQNNIKTFLIIKDTLTKIKIKENKDNFKFYYDKDTLIKVKTLEYREY